MPLDHYRSKRNFSKSTEPPGDAAPRATPSLAVRFFCVQKHLASQLHYDLRLEHNGVLWSWAVPKGPSLDPAAKRLAMHVEDHPLEYGNFEGVIPEGYGAGIVMLWDHGTWQPEVDDPDAALRKGDLKFTLDGYKLKGSWVLVRTRDRSDVSPGQRGRSWLLIKHRDHWSGAIDITTFAPRSVKSEGDFEDILADDMPEVWVSNRPARSGATGALLTQLIERATEKMLARTHVGRVGQVGRVRTAARNAGAHAAMSEKPRSAASSGRTPKKSPASRKPVRTRRHRKS